MRRRAAWSCSGRFALRPSLGLSSVFSTEIGLQEVRVARRQEAERHVTLSTDAPAVTSSGPRPRELQIPVAVPERVVAAQRGAFRVHLAVESPRARDPRAAPSAQDPLALELRPLERGLSCARRRSGSFATCSGPVPDRRDREIRPGGQRPVPAEPQVRLGRVEALGLERGQDLPERQVPRLPLAAQGRSAAACRGRRRRPPGSRGRRRSSRPRSCGSRRRRSGS